MAISSPGRSPALDRGLLPEILTPADLALALSLPSAAAARRLLVAGGLCPSVRLGRRLFVRRTALMAALAARETGARPVSPGFRDPLRGLWDRM